MWVPQKNEDFLWQENCQQKKKTRQKTSDHCLIPVKFPKAARLLKRGQFQKVAREGTRLVGRVVSIQYINRNSAPYAKLGITISKKFGKAHVRNRFKRVVREAFRECAPKFPQGLEVHVLPRNIPDNIKKQDVLLDLGLLLSRISPI